MSRRPAFGHIQGPRSHSEREYEFLQETILRETSVVCTVMVLPGRISIRVETLPDFYLAKLAIKGMAGSREIIRSI